MSIANPPVDAERCEPGTTRARAAFVSDLHLGSRGCRPEPLLGFLRSLDCETLYVVGDFIDCWRLKRRAYLPESHRAVIAQVLSMARAGMRIVYVPGNHDAVVRRYAGVTVAGVEIALETTHVTTRGRRVWVTHGDQYDRLEQRAPLVSMLAAAAYEQLHVANAAVNHVRTRLGRETISLTGGIRARAKRVAGSSDDYERATRGGARERGLDAVVCGHVHRPAAIRGEIDYFNCGDWIDSCSALIEDAAGELRLVRRLAASEPVEALAA